MTGQTDPGRNRPSFGFQRGAICWPSRLRSLLVALLGVVVAAQAIALVDRHPGGVSPPPFLPICKASALLHPEEAPFLAANDAAMSKMMDGMAVNPTGNVDADFSAMMIPHHQGAIEMAAAELRFGHNALLRRIAQEIIVDQQGEIAAMRFALGQSLPPSAPAPTGGATPPSSFPAQAPSATP